MDDGSNGSDALEDLFEIEFVKQLEEVTDQYGVIFY
jgi:hypothetical protein